MRNLSLRFKLFFIVGGLSAVAIVVAWGGVQKLSDMNARLNSVVDSSAKKVELGLSIQKELLAISRAEKNMLLAEKQEQVDEFAKAIASRMQEMKEHRQQLRKLVDDDGRQKLDGFAEVWEQWLAVHDEVQQLARANSNVVARGLSANESRKAFDNAEQALRELLRISDTEDQKGTIISLILADALKAHRAEKNIILETNPTEMAYYSDQIRKLNSSVDQRVRKLEGSLPTEQQRILDDFKTSWERFLNTNEQVQAKSMENSNVKGFELATTKGRALADKAEALLVDLVEKNNKDMAEDSRISDENYEAARLMLLLVSCIGIGLALIISFFVVQETIKILKKVFGGLKKCSTAELEDASETLNQIVANLTDGANQVSSAAGQVSAASQSLAEGASEQAASLEETSSSLEEMASMTQQNNGSAQEANSLMSKAMELVRNGQESMSRLEQAINEIKNSADETSKIVGTINEIAFQTNLLALNAAVEAARAGDAGRGFAVVADEVGNLAKRAGEAARTTAELIEGSVKNAERGVNVAQETSKSLDAVTQTSEKTSSLIAEIAAASNEQSQGITQINKAVAQLDTVTQQNSSTAEESAAAAEELSAQSDQMQKVVLNLRRLVESSDDSQKAPSEHRNNASKVFAIKDHKKKAAKVKTGPSTKVQVSPIKNTEEKMDTVFPMDKNNDKEVVNF